ncbi:MAG: hypothetical protein VW870_04135 [Rhodobiaceae bacterium]
MFKNAIDISILLNGIDLVCNLIARRFIPEPEGKALIFFDELILVVRVLPITPVGLDRCLNLAAVLQENSD